MAYFVYYDDDYPECGGRGLAYFDKEEDALEFINSRFNAHYPYADESCYELIVGDRIKIKVSPAPKRKRIRKIFVDR